MYDYKPSHPQNDYSEIERNRPQKSLCRKVAEIIGGSSLITALIGGSVLLAVKKADEIHAQTLNQLKNCKNISYKIKEGDTLFRIAEREGIRAGYDQRTNTFIDYVTELNKIDPKKGLISGQSILVPDVNEDGYVGSKYDLKK